MITKVEDTEGMPRTIEIKSNGRSRCNIGDTTMFIYTGLDIRLCPTLRPIGNLKDRLNIKDVWFGQDARDLRQEISKCDKICTMSCLRRVSLMDKIVLYLGR